jgi:hypothetical protein
MARQLLGGQRVLVAKESIVHLPIFTLVAGAVGGLGRFECQRMNRF